VGLVKGGRLATGKAASRLIDQRIRELEGWRGETLARMRALILKADPGITEEWKWSVPVWSHHGIVCTGESYKAAVKLTGDRHPRRGDGGRGRVQGAREGRGGAERGGVAAAVDRGW